MCSTILRFNLIITIQVAISLLAKVEGDLLAAESFEQVILAFFSFFVFTLILYAAQVMAIIKTQLPKLKPAVLEGIIQVILIRMTQTGA